MSKQLIVMLVFVATKSEFSSILLQKESFKKINNCFIIMERHIGLINKKNQMIHRNQLNNRILSSSNDLILKLIFWIII